MEQKLQSKSLHMQGIKLTSLEEKITMDIHFNTEQLFGGVSFLTFP